MDHSDDAAPDSLPPPIRATKESLQRIRDNCPDELKDQPRWICWNGTRKVDGKLNKAPIDPASGCNAKTNDPNTWGSFEQAVEYALEDSRVGGLGLVLTGSDYWALDLDHIVDLANGEVAPQVGQFLVSLDRTYVETSPSRDGLHVLFRGQRPSSLAKTKAKDAFGPGMHLEVFGGASARYVTVTGEAWWNGSTDLTEASPEAVDLVLSMFKLQEAKKSPCKKRLRVVRESDLPEERRCEIASALYSIPPSIDREDWLRAIYGLHAACGGSGFGAELVEEWSSKSSIPNQYKRGEAERIYSKTSLPGELEGRSPIGPGTLFKMAHQHRWGVPWVFDEVHDDGTEARVFPISALPPVCRAMVEEGALAQGVDVAYWAVPLLGILAGCIGATRAIELKPGWIEPSVLWTAIVAPSGAGKSPPLRELISGVRDHDNTLHKKTVSNQKLYAAQLETWKAKKGSKASKKKPEPPALKSAIVNDITIEALVARLADNPRGLLLAVDELAGWIRSFNKYRKGGGDEQSWLSIHNADPVKVDRKGGTGLQQRIYVRRAAVSIVGTIQPGIAKQYIGSEENRDSGLAARLLLAEPPVSPAKWTDRAIPIEVRENFQGVVQTLLRLDLKRDDPVILPLDATAQKLFIAFHDENGRACQAAARSSDHDLAAVLSKLRGAAARIALVVALARAAETEKPLEVVDAEAMEGGIAIAGYFESEARRLYARWRRDVRVEDEDRTRLSDEELEARIVALIRDKPRSRSELSSAFHRNVRAVRIQAILDSLRHLGDVDSRQEKTGQAGRPREIWFWSGEQKGGAA